LLSASCRLQPVSLSFAAYPLSQLDSSLLQLLHDQQGKTVNAVTLAIVLMAFTCFSSDKVTELLRLVVGLLNAAFSLFLFLAAVLGKKMPVLKTSAN